MRAKRCWLIVHHAWWWLVQVALWSCVCSCGGGEQLPEDPGLLQDGLGLGLRLGVAVAEAREAASDARGKAEVWVMTREELNKRNPYAERPPDQDLVVALYSPYPTEGAGANGRVAYERITELRCYLARSDSSRVRLLRSPASGLTPESAAKLLGPPLATSTDADGSTHLSFGFSLPAAEAEHVRWKSLELVTSHSPDGVCFALKLLFGR